MEFLTLTFATFTLIGGIIGYFKANSKPSLIAGVSSALWLYGMTWAYHNQYPWGFAGLIFGCLLLGSYFGKKFVVTGKWMPAGITLALSVVTLVGLVVFEVWAKPLIQNPPPISLDEVTER